MADLDENAPIPEVVILLDAGGDGAQEVDDDQQLEAQARPSLLSSLLARIRPFLVPRPPQPPPPPNENGNNPGGGANDNGNNDDGSVHTPPNPFEICPPPPSDAAELSRLRTLQRSYTQNPDAVPPLTRTLRTFYLPNPITGDTSLHTLCLLRPPARVVRDMIELWPDMRVLLRGLRLHLGEEALQRALDNAQDGGGGFGPRSASALVCSDQAFVCRRNRAGATALHVALACGAGGQVVDLLLNEGGTELVDNRLPVVDVDYFDDGDDSDGDPDSDGDDYGDREYSFSSSGASGGMCSPWRRRARPARPPSMASLPMDGGTYPLHIACRYSDDLGSSTPTPDEPDDHDNDDEDERLHRRMEADAHEASRVILRLLREDEAVALRRSGVEGRNALNLLWMSEYAERKRPQRRRRGATREGAEAVAAAPNVAAAVEGAADAEGQQHPGGENNDGGGENGGGALAGDNIANNASHSNEAPIQTVSALLRLVRLVNDEPSLRDLVPRPPRVFRHVDGEVDDDDDDGEHDSAAAAAPQNDAGAAAEADARIGAAGAQIDARSNLAGLVRWAFGKKFRTLWECSSEMVLVREKSKRRARERRERMERRIRREREEEANNNARRTAKKKRRGKRQRQSLLREATLASSSSSSSPLRGGASTIIACSPLSPPPLRRIYRRSPAPPPPLLHSIASYPQCPPDLIYLSYLHGHRPSARLFDCNGRLPLHLAASNMDVFLPPRPFKLRNFFGNEGGSEGGGEGLSSIDDDADKSDETVLSALLREYPTAAHIQDRTGRLPLHHGAARGCGGGWHETGLDGLVKAHPEALTTRDGVTGLYPFMLAGARREVNDGYDDAEKGWGGSEECRRRREREELNRLHSSFEMLKAAPEILTFEGITPGTTTIAGNLFELKKPKQNAGADPEDDMAVRATSTGRGGRRKRKREGREQRTMWARFSGWLLPGIKGEEAPCTSAGETEEIQDDDRMAKRTRRI